MFVVFRITGFQNFTAMVLGLGHVGGLSFWIVLRDFKVFTVKGFRGLEFLGLWFLRGTVVLGILGLSGFWGLRFFGVF